MRFQGREVFSHRGQHVVGDEFSWGLRDVVDKMISKVSAWPTYDIFPLGLDSAHMSDTLPDKPEFQIPVFLNGWHFLRGVFKISKFC